MVTGIDTYKDGGTTEIKTMFYSYCIDNRIGSTTKGKLYKGYPKKDNSNIISDKDAPKIIRYLTSSLKRYKFRISLSADCAIEEL